ncbi:MAG: hypothetical protein AAFQ98_19200 [Bacteroidota bacterium]
MKKRMMWFWGVRFLLFMAFALVGFSVAVMLLWNAVLPDVLGVAEISWVQALGLLALSRIFFGSWGRGGGGRWGGGHPRHKQWKEHWMSKWDKMTPEQQAAMKKKWAEHGGPWGRHRGPVTTETVEAEEVKPEDKEG